MKMEEDVDDVDEKEKLEVKAEAQVIFANSKITKEQLKNKSLRKLIIAKYQNTEEDNEEQRITRQIYDKNYYNKE